MSRRRKHPRGAPAPANARPATRSRQHVGAAFEELHENPEALGMLVRHVLGTSAAGDQAPVTLTAVSANVGDNSSISPQLDDTHRWSSTWCVRVADTDTIIVHHGTGTGDNFDCVATYITTRSEVAAREEGESSEAVNPWHTPAAHTWGCEAIAVAEADGISISLRDSSGTLGADTNTFEAVRASHLDGFDLFGFDLFDDELTCDPVEDLAQPPDSGDTP